MKKKKISPGASLKPIKPGKSGTISGSMIARCNCYHKFQDETYGEGFRVFNMTNSSKHKARCTVCGKEI